MDEQHLEASRVAGDLFVESVMPAAHAAGTQLGPFGLLSFYQALITAIYGGMAVQFGDEFAGACLKTITERLTAGAPPGTTLN